MREVSQPFRLKMQLHFKLNPRSRMISDKWKMVFLCFQLLPVPAACPCRLLLPLPPAPALPLPPAPASCRSLVGTEALAALPGWSSGFWSGDVVLQQLLRSCSRANHCEFLCTIVTAEYSDNLGLLVVYRTA